MGAHLNPLELPVNFFLETCSYQHLGLFALVLRVCSPHSYSQFVVVPVVAIDKLGVEHCLIIAVQPCDNCFLFGGQVVDANLLHVGVGQD